MPGGLAAEIRFGTPLHRRICSALQARYKASNSKMTNFHKRWKEAEDSFLAYIPEKEADAARRVERQKGKPQYTTIVLPYSYAVLMTSHTYWTTVFMGRNPIMQYSGRHGEGEQQVQALEAMIDYQVQVGEMIVPLYIWLLDVGKYGMGIIGDFWDEERSVVSELIETPPSTLDAILGRKPKKSLTRREVAGYEGNKIYNVRPVNFFPDPRVPVWQFQRGEFVAVRIELGWNEILRRKAQGYYFNTDQLRKRGSGDRGGLFGGTESDATQTEYPSETEAIPNPRLSDEELTDTKFYSSYEFYVDLVPSEWGLGNSDYPEKWCFTVTSDFGVLFGASPLGLDHNKYPFQVIELEPQGYSMIGRGYPEILQPVQNTMDWLFNTHMYNVRKVLHNQVVVDPSRVVMSDLLDPIPGGAIRLRPRAYGSDPKTAYSQFQMVDITRSHLEDLKIMMDFGARVTGVHDQIMGMLNATGRKTAAEVRTSSTFGINRLKTAAEFFSAMGWAPLSQRLVQTSQQFYSADKKFKIVGDLAQEAGMNFIDVDPEKIQGFYDFVPVDGTLPVDRFAQANLWRSIFEGVAIKDPRISAQFDVARIFSWVAQLAGLKNINQFKIQITPDQKVLADAQAGNLIPMRKPGMADLGRNKEPGQVGGLGTTA